LIKEKEKTSKLSNSLSNQINEKLKAKNNLDSLEKKFLEEQKELLKKQDEKEKLAKQEKEKKSTEEKEIRDKILRQSMDIKQKHKNDKMEFERKNLDKWKEEVKEEELKKKTRKNSEINIFHQILQENQDKINKAKINKEEELNQNKKFLDEYTKILEKQNDQREDYYKKIKERTNISAKTTVNVGEDQKILVNYEESKYQKEKEEINNKLNAIDKENHMKKNKMIEEMKKNSRYANSRKKEEI